MNGRLDVLLVDHHQQAAGQSGDEARDGEGAELGPVDVDPVAGHRLLVGAQGPQHPAEPAVAQAAHGHHHQHPHPEDRWRTPRLCDTTGTPNSRGVGSWPVGDPRELGRSRKYPDAARPKARVVTATKTPSRRSVGRPTTKATTAAGRPGGQQGQTQVPVPVDHGHGPGHRAHGGERHLAQAHLAGPSGEHDDRAPHDGQHEQGGDLEEAARPEPQRQGDQEGQEHGGAPQRGEAHLGEAPQRGRDVSRTPVARAHWLPRSSRAPDRWVTWRKNIPRSTTPAMTASTRVGATTGPSCHPLLEGADGHGGQGHHRQVGESTQGQSRQRADQGGQAEGGIEGQADDGRLQEDAEEREHPGHHPGDRLQPVDRDARAWRPGPVGHRWPGWRCPGR